MGYTEYKFGNIINSTPNNANAINYNEDNTVSDKIEEIDNSIETLDSKVNNIQSHIGMVIHFTTLDTEEKVKAIYGGNTWEKIEGQFLLGASSTHAVNTTGGEETHTLTVEEMVAHTHSIPSLSGTAAQVGNHQHKSIDTNIMEFHTLSGSFVSSWAAANGNNVGFFNAYNCNTSAGGAHSHSITTNASTSGSNGSSSAHNNMPPYKTVYIWERIA